MAQQAFAQDEVPVGAIIVHDGQVIAQAHNMTRQLGDPTAHAEMLAIKQALAKVGPVLDQCQLYVTLEPCAMCAQAMAHVQLGALCYGAYDVKGGAVDHGPRLFTQATTLYAPKWYGGILEASCAQILKDFFATKR